MSVSRGNFVDHDSLMEVEEAEEALEAFYQVRRDHKQYEDLRKTREEDASEEEFLKSFPEKGAFRPKDLEVPKYISKAQMTIAERVL